MRARLEQAQEGVVAATQAVLLPAAYTGPEDFLHAGFVAAARERALPLDLAFVDLNLTHLTDRTLLRRLRHEIILPARAMGCRTIWLCGISLGGFVALAYAERYPGEIDGVCVLAPYLGNRIITGEIAAAGGVQSWEPGDLAPDDDERHIWRFIKTRGGRVPGARALYPVSVHLGFGSEDRFADSHRMMAAALPPEMVDVQPGGHDWPVWRQLWENFLDARLRAAPSTRAGLQPTA
jgi:pimeloyl-ACP methyl ester carboxylesterase